MANYTRERGGYPKPKVRLAPSQKMTRGLRRQPSIASLVKRIILFSPKRRQRPYV